VLSSIRILVHSSHQDTDSRFTSRYWCTVQWLGRAIIHQDTGSRFTSRYWCTVQWLGRAIIHQDTGARFNGSDVPVCRSQWSSGSMSDCSARDPGIESRCGQLCLSHNHCDLQPWARAVCTLPAVPRSTQPSTLRGMVNEYQLSG